MADSEVSLEVQIEELVTRINERYRSTGGNPCPFLVTLIFFLTKEDCFEQFKSDILYVRGPENRKELKEIQMSFGDSAHISNWKGKEEIYQILMNLDPGFEAMWFILNKDDQRVLSQTERDQLLRYYPKYIETAIRVEANMEGKKGPYGALPKELVKFVLEIAQIPPNGVVYNPFAGLASIGAMLPKDRTYYGQELNNRNWAIGMIRLLAQRPGSINIFKPENAVYESWNKHAGSYDLIVAEPPFGLRVHDDQEEIEGPISAELLFIHRAVRDVKDNGKVILIASPSFLFSTRREDLKIRGSILESGWLDSVTLFPGGLLTHSAIQVAVVVVDKSRDPRKPVRMVDATQYVSRIGRGRQSLETEGLIQAFHAGDPKEVRLVPIDDICATQNNWSPTRYFIARETLRGVSLSTVATTVRVERTKLNSPNYYIGIRDLKESSLDFSVSAQDLETKEVPAFAKLLSRSALLVALEGDSLKPTWFEYNFETIAIARNILPLEIDESKVFVPYLVHELLSSKSKEQTAAMNSGTSISRLSQSDVLMIRIELPELALQIAKIEGLKEAHVAHEVRRLQEEAKRHGVELQRFSGEASFKHLLGTPLLNIGSGVEILRNALGVMDPKWQERVVSAREQIGLGAIMDNVARELQRIRDVLDSDSMELNVMEYPLEPLDFVAYAEAKAQQVKVDLNGGHQVSIVFHSDITDILDNEAWVKGNTALLDIAIDAIVENARRHAFSSDGSMNYLQFALNYVYEDLTPLIGLAIRNSGKPFPEGFEEADYVRKNSYSGKSGHSGIGGYHVKQVVSRHEGILVVETRSNTVEGDHVTEIEMYFPIN